MGVSQREFLSRLGVVRLVDPITEDAYKHVAHHRWENDLDSSPHGQPWHTSFHASEFPGDDPKACARKALYGLMGLPAGQPIEPRGLTVMDAGKDIERQVVKRWEEYGILLSAGPDAEVQTAFEFPEWWLTGSTDAIIKPPGWNRGHVIEVKTKYDDVINQMKLGQKSYDEVHRRQCLTYIGMANAVSSELWPELDPVIDGSIYYISRDRPRNTVEYFFDLDSNFLQLGVERLAQWKQYFLEGHLPERPKEWRWTEEPCKWCPVKRQCKMDIKADVYKLEDSATIEYAKGIRKDYDYATKRAIVLDRWANES